MKAAIRNCLAILLLTSIIAFSPYYISDTHASATVRITTRSESELVRVVEGDTPKSVPNTQAVNSSGFWVVMGFGAVLFAMFVFLSYRRQQAKPGDEHGGDNTREV